MDATDNPWLKFLHTGSTLNRVKLDLFRRLSTAGLKASLAPGEEGALKARGDGTMIVYRER